MPVKIKPPMQIVKQVGDLSAYGMDIDLIPSAVVLVAQFNKLGLDLRSFKEPLTRVVRDVMAPSIKKNFDAGGRPKWKQLKQNTIDKKTWMGYSNPSAPLIATGRLRRRASEIGIWEINGIEGYAAITTLRDAQYGIFHQEGVVGEMVGVISGPIGRTSGTISAVQMGGFPARPFLMFQKKDENDIDRIFIRWFQERATMAGFRPGVGI